MQTRSSKKKENHHKHSAGLNWAATAALMIAACVPCTTRADGDGSENYRQTNLVSDLPDIAVLQDTNLLNAWGISFSSTSPFWVSANGTGKSPLYSVTYDAMGVVQVAKVPLDVNIPGEGNPTGQAFNGTSGFNGDIFLFASEDGTISGWQSALGNEAEVLANRPTAIYKGMTLAMTASGPSLFAANFSEGTVDVYDTNLNLVAQLTDPRAPSDYSPFNVQSVGEFIVVTFAKHSPGGEDDVAGPGHGIIDILNPWTGRMHRFATGTDAGGNIGAMNSPWGVALAPRHFGNHGDELLVGNFGSGTIMAFDAHGRFKGLLQKERHQALVIDGLWALTFGNGGKAGRPETLYFSAGPGGEAHGLLGAIDPVKERGRGRGRDEGDDQQGRGHY